MGRSVAVTVHADAPCRKLAAARDCSKVVGPGLDQITALNQVVDPFSQCLTIEVGLF
jgi:hypothetical protein